MYMVFSDAARKLYEDVLPWFAGVELINGEFVQTFKKGTPEHILAKYAKWKAQTAAEIATA